MNILTFDIEDWSLEKRLWGNRKEIYTQYDKILEEILQTLEENNSKATFFCLGLMAEDFPHIIRKIAEAGHEIGCHSHTHSWLNKMSDDEMREDTHSAICSLEDCVGKKVVSYRAPSFSIGESNKKHFEILFDEGIRVDSSVFPSSREIGGFSSFESMLPVTIEVGGVTLKEFPISMVKSMGRRLVISGGGYFRIYPEWVIRKWVKASPYTMFYFHIKDFQHNTVKMFDRPTYEEYFKEPGTLVNRCKRYVKDNLAMGHPLDKFKSLSKDLRMYDMNTAIEEVDWDKSIRI